MRNINNEVSDYENASILLRSIHEISKFYEIPKEVMISEATIIIRDSIGLDFSDNFLKHSAHWHEVKEDEICVNLEQCIKSYKGDHPESNITIQSLNKILYILGYQLEEKGQNQRWILTDKGKPFTYVSKTNKKVYWKYSKIKKVIDHFHNQLGLSYKI